MTSYLSFVTASHDVTTAYVGHHLTSLVILSLAMAILAALASFYHTNLIKRTQVQWHRFAWHLSGALTMGIGVWAMHFIGMISFRIDVPIYYSVPITAVSVLPAIVAAWITLWVLRKDQQTLKTIAIGGLFMGAGIGAMHYTGMAAMQADADIRYLPGMFVLSVFVAVLLAALSLGARTWLAPIVKNDNRRTLVSAVIMGIAVSSMHYTAMHATVFLPVETGIGAHSGLDAGQLLVSTIIVTVFLVVLSTTVVILVSKQLGLRQSARQRAKEVRALSERLRKITERVPGMVFQLRRDPTGYLQFSYLSQASERLFGIPPHEAMEEPKKVLSLVPEKERLKIVETLAESAATMSPWNHEFPVHTPSGEARWMASNAMPQQERSGVVSWSGFISDVTEKRAQEQIIHQMAFYDGLTGLPNRKFIVRQLAELLVRKDERRPTVIALLVNLDGFKRINDVHGQAVGDAVLHTCAERLRELTSGDM
ncbi:hypothetical protein CWE11_11000 [Aliidiomarina sanyensis]|uniref:Bifunctional diguanylate cyclase/phosphodiesterase n=1 Tax=Aliidiomarina sanyensis TaxID=1249555 RepID=A0A432WCE2_9GAMM|nr:MHYT domain-containing protein [Aliidiomarina sanyensis]RUO27957.1 hypothetical protein CWE11_11000 [Aliidiomarina sanyensis]